MQKNNSLYNLFANILVAFGCLFAANAAFAEISQNLVTEEISTPKLDDQKLSDQTLEKQDSKNKTLENQTLETQAPEKSASQDPVFNVFEIKVNGNTVLPIGKIEEAVYPFLGETKSITDVEKARAALEKTYQDAGYLTVSVSIPQQEVDAGIVNLQVTEGSIEKLRIKDAQYSSLAEIKSRVGEFGEGKVPHFPTAQAQLGTVNRGQNRQVTPVLRAGKSPGKVEVDLKVQDKLPLHGSLELNDRYSQNTTETRLNGSLRYENLWQKDHSIGISFQVSPEDLNETKVVSGTYVIPRMNGDYFAAYGVISKSDISAVGDVSVVGNGVIVGARYIHPLPLVDNYYHSMTLGADYKDFKETIRILGSDVGNNPIAYTAFSLAYDGTLNLASSQTQMNVGVNFAPRGLGNSEEEFRNKRSFANPNYAYLRGDLKYTQKLPLNWALQAKLSGQLAGDPLISAEQFTIGGADSVRGYVESQALGDNGLFTSLELRTPPLIKHINNNAFKDYIKELYAFTFVDAGHVSTLKATPGQDKKSDLMSAGLGVKLKFSKGIFTNLDYAHALRDAGDIEKDDDRLHFRLGYEW